MSNRSKGNRNELKCEKILQRMGYLTHRSYPTKFGVKDYFELWDILAIKKGLIKPKLVQVKTNRKPYGKYLHEFTKFARNYITFDCEIWVWKDYKGFTVHKYENDRWKKTYSRLKK